MPSLSTIRRVLFARRSVVGEAGAKHRYSLLVRFALRKEGREHHKVMSALAKVMILPKLLVSPLHAPFDGYMDAPL